MRGAWRTVESVIAGVVILMFVAALGATTLQATPTVPVQGYRALGAVYEKGELRAHAAGMNCSAIESLVSGTGYLHGYGHSVQVCDAQGTCCGQVPEEENVWVSSVILAGDDEYDPAEVVLYIFREGG
jgi:hypothetical protein